MKKIYLFSLIILAFVFTSFAQPYYLGGTIGHHFIQGNTGVVNSLITNGAYPAGTVTTKFLITDVNRTTAYAVSWGTYDSNNDYYYLDIDMGSLPSNAPQNLVAYASFYDVNGNPLGGVNGTTTQDWAFTLTPIPEWITTYSGQVTNTTVNYGNNTLSMQGALPLSSLLALNKSVSGVLGLAGKAFNMTNQNLTFNITYDMATGTATGAQASVSGDFQPLDNSSTAIAGTNFSGNITFDTDFNLTFNGTTIFSPAPIIKSYSFENVPLAGPNFQFASIGALCVNTSLEFSLSPKIKAQIYAGYDISSQHWGFKHNGSDVTQFLGKVTASATAKGELKAVCGSAFGFNIGWGTLARGQVTSDLNIGGGIQYYNIPNATPTNLWYGDFSIHAEGQVLGYDTKSGDYTPASWGNSSNFNFKTENTANEFFQNATTESRSVQTPAAWPMGKIATRDSIAATAWVDDINFSNETALLVSYYSPVTNTFSSPITVAQNDSGVTNPSISLLPNKNVFVTWSQLNKSKGQLAGVNLDDVTKSQDIYIAIIDITSNSVVYKNKLTDATSDGRADGEPRIHWGNGNQGMITWQAGDNINMGSDIYAAEIVESGGNYTIYNHSVLNATVPGFNYNITVAYGNNNEAIATWFNDPDMNQTTNNSEIYYSSWNGSAWWLTPQLRYDAGSLGINIKDYSLATHDSYGVEALTYEYFDANEETVNGVLLRGWNDGDLISLLHPYFTSEDNTQDFALPQVSVSRNGIASLVLQEKNLQNPNSEGRLNLYLKDLNNLPAQWQEVIHTNPQYAQFIADTNQFVWDMSAKFGYLSNSSDVIYLFTQEMDNAGNTNATSYGEPFGNPNLNLLLRAFQVNNTGGNITLTDLPEPSTDNITGFYQELQPFNNTFELKPSFPNPFNDETHIPFHLYQGSDVKIELYNLSGQSMGEIYNASLSAGSYVTTFRRRNLESGIYFYRVIMGNDVQTGKMVITD